MNGRLGLAGISIIFAILSACGGGSDGSSGSTAPQGDTPSTPGSNNGTNPPPDNSAGGGRPSNVAGFVYVANANSDSISAYSIDASNGKLLAIAGMPFATGDTPWDLAIHPSGKFVYVANHYTSDVSAYAVDARTGALTMLGAVAAAPGPLSITLDPAGKFAYVTSSGIEDGKGGISAYSIDAATGRLSESPGSPFAAGATPNLLTVDLSGKFAYATFKTSSSDRIDTVVSYSINRTTGALTQIGTAKTGYSPGIFTLDPKGRFAYVGNRLSPDISAYSIDPDTGVLTEIAGSPFTVPHGAQSITVDVAGRFLYVPHTDDNVNRLIAVYAVNANTGALTEIAGSPFASDWFAAPVTIDPSGRFAYIGSGSGITVYSIDDASGALTNMRSFAMPRPSFRVNIDPSGRVGYSVDSPRVDPGTILAFTVNSMTGEVNYIGSVPTESGGVELNIIW